MSANSPPMTPLGFSTKARPARRRKEGDGSSGAPSRQARILVVDNDPDLRRLLSIRLGAANYQVSSVDSAEAALDACVRSRPNLVITDLRMEHMDGLALLKELKSRWPDLSVIILTAHGTIPEAVQATQRGAFGFLVKPVEKSELLGQVERAIKASNFSSTEGDWRSDIVSRSRLMEDRLARANRAAGSDATVLLTGESGTGKELFARAIHAASTRREQPFIAVACRNPDEKLLESALFGHAHGALEHPDEPRVGAFEAARGGTLLLDEIGDLPLRLQVKLVQALRTDRDSCAVSPGAQRTDVRLICTTSCDLRELMNSGRFQESLYYLINVLAIDVPPLGRRREDIPLLVSHFLQQATVQSGEEKLYSPEALQLLVTTEWPGNVRQLFDLVKQNVALSDSKVISQELVQQSLGSVPKEVPSYEAARDDFTRDYLIKNLQSTSGNVSQSARLAKRNRTDFYKLLSRYRLMPDDFK